VAATDCTAGPAPSGSELLVLKPPGIGWIATATVDTFSFLEKKKKIYFEKRKRRETIRCVFNQPMQTHNTATRNNQTGP
jgi:hypothetical protein